MQASSGATSPAYPIRAPPPNPLCGRDEVGGDQGAGPPLRLRGAARGYITQTGRPGPNRTCGPGAGAQVGGDEDRSRTGVPAGQPPSWAAPSAGGRQLRTLRAP
ncbi:hypothetical protein [Ornithinimicrobium kibberense]|uniref:hypothetical protein n=1 Tax=Ornithinimicrobium kibberense TaxID=282060 RepID=UPI003617CE61